MRALSILFCLILSFQNLEAQTIEPKLPTFNARLSFLIFPFSPLLTLEIRTLGKVTIQPETNFADIHGVNLKNFLNERMNGSFMFVGSAFIENDFLRKDRNITYLPYSGYGYAHRFGNKKQWTFDSRIGIGMTTNADANSVYPVIKTGIGRVF